MQYKRKNFRQIWSLKGLFLALLSLTLVFQFVACGDNPDNKKMSPMDVTDSVLAQWYGSFVGADGTNFNINQQAKTIDISNQADITVTAYTTSTFNDGTSKSVTLRIEKPDRSRFTLNLDPKNDAALIEDFYKEIITEFKSARDKNSGPLEQDSINPYYSGDKKYTLSCEQKSNWNISKITFIPKQFKKIKKLPEFLQRLMTLTQQEAHLVDLVFNHQTQSLVGSSTASSEVIKNYFTKMGDNWCSFNFDKFLAKSQNLMSLVLGGTGLDEFQILYMQNPQSYSDFAKVHPFFNTYLKLDGEKEISQKFSKKELKLPYEAVTFSTGFTSFEATTMKDQIAKGMVDFIKIDFKAETFQIRRLGTVGSYCHAGLNYKIAKLSYPSNRNERRLRHIDLILDSVEKVGDADSAFCKYTDGNRSLLSDLMTKNSQELVISFSYDSYGYNMQGRFANSIELDKSQSAEILKIPTLTEGHAFNRSFMDEVEAQHLLTWF